MTLTDTERRIVAMLEEYAREVDEIHSTAGGFVRDAIRLIRLGQHKDARYD